jgi:hypothetical protein
MQRRRRELNLNPQGLIRRKGNAMRDEKSITMQQGDETWTIAWGVEEDGRAYIRETSEGAMTVLLYGAMRRETTYYFYPTEDYGIADIERRVAMSRGDCYLADFIGALAYWDVPYSKEEKVTPLVA